MKTVYLSVTNDILTDQRVNRIAKTLADTGLKVTIVGVKRKKSKQFSPEGYNAVLLQVPFQKGFLFYASYNFNLFWYLLFHKSHVLVANDLDSLPANYLVSILKRNILVYDSHELYTEVPELVHRPRVKKVWTAIEKTILPKLNHSYTVCESIAKYYQNLYKIPFGIVRNVPFRKVISKEKLDLPEIKDKKIIIYQGALNVGRGIENAIKAMTFLDDAILLIAGKGDVENELKILVYKEKLEEKVIFLGSLPPEQLFKYTCNAHIGFSLEQHIGMSYYYALPNKLFDYIQSEIPVLVSNLPEMVAIVQKFDIGEISISQEPQALAIQFHEMLHNEEKQRKWKQNLSIAAKELCWENEKEILLEIYKKAGVI